MVAPASRKAEPVADTYPAFPSRFRWLDPRARFEEKELAKQTDFYQALHDRHRTIEEQIERLRSVFEQSWTNGTPNDR